MKPHQVHPVWGCTGLNKSPVSCKACFCCLKNATPRDAPWCWCGCSSGCVLQEVSAALCFGALVPDAEQQLLSLLGLYFLLFQRNGLVLPVSSLPGEVQVFLRSPPFSLHLGAWVRLPELPKALKGCCVQTQLSRLAVHH